MNLFTTYETYEHMILLSILIIEVYVFHHQPPWTTVIHAIRVPYRQCTSALQGPDLIAADLVLIGRK